MQAGFYDWSREHQWNIGKMKKFFSESFYFVCKVGSEIIAEYKGFRETKGYQRFNKT